jgi:ATP-dependent Lon protease
LVLDEVDKMGSDMRGDPAAALLEVLDPAQNDTFQDHYIDLPFDLSEVTFIATANYRYNIPEALRDRMETIEVPGYTRSEKCAIARQFLVPKQIKEHGLTPAQLEFENEGIECLVDFYTREAGVRNLEREVAAVCRDVTVKIADGSAPPHTSVTAELVRELLGPEKHRPELSERKLSPGVAVGLSVSGAGGDLLIIEATRMPGKGEIYITGSLRNVAKESAATAVSFVRSRAERLRLDPEWLKSIDLHLHVPRGGSARDAASAGVAMFVAVTSLLLRAPVKPDVAVAGELTLRGSVLPVGGIKDQVLAAHRAGIREIVLPAQNARDLEEVPPEVKVDLRFHLVHRLDEVLPLVLAEPEPDPDDEDEAAQSPPGEAHV